MHLTRILYFVLRFFAMKYCACKTYFATTYSVSDGWVKGTDNFKYRCSMEENSFPEAQDTCKKWGGNLLMEKEGETRNFVLKMYSNKSIWIGVKRDKQTKKFMYVDGSNITPTHWTKKGPGNEDCVHHSGTKNKWSTDSCSKKKLFLCQKSRLYF